MIPRHPSPHPMPRLLSALLLIPLIAACSGGPAGTASPSASRAASAGASGAVLPSDVSSEAPSGSADASPRVPSSFWHARLRARAGRHRTSIGPPTPKAGTTAAAKALNEYVTGPEGADLPDSGWRELYRSKELALYGQDDPSGEANVLLVATISQSNGTWAGEGSSQCRPRTWLGNSLGIAADWRLSAKTTRTTKVLRTLVTERACASGESAKGRLAKPKITVRGRPHRDHGRCQAARGATGLPGQSRDAADHHARRSPRQPDTLQRRAIPRGRGRPAQVAAWLESLSYRDTPPATARSRAASGAGGSAGAGSDAGTCPTSRTEQCEW